MTKLVADCRRSAEIRVSLCLALFLALISGGCASVSGQIAGLDVNARVIELDATPFHPQERFQCGPAALLTLLEHSGVQSTLSSLTDQVYVPARRGSLQPELVAATRAADRVPYVIDGSIAAIHEELLAGRPVLVLQNLGVSWWPRWHYAVVVGIDPGAREVYLRSGTERRRKTSLATFLRTWQRSQFWALVALRPNELPARPDPMRYFDSVADLEATGHLAASRIAWETAVIRWPDEWVANFGHANAAYAAGNYIEAERYYRQLLDLRPGQLVARNNLALALSKLGQHAAAIEQIELVLREADRDGTLYGEFEASRLQILTDAGHDPSVAPLQ